MPQLDNTALYDYNKRRIDATGFPATMDYWTPSDSWAVGMYRALDSSDTVVTIDESFYEID